jgi:hypothetical protein
MVDSVLIWFPEVSGSVVEYVEEEHDRGVRGDVASACPGVG